MKRLVSPIAVAAVLALVLTLGMFFYLSLTIGDLSQGGAESLRLGPLTFLTIGRAVTAAGSEATLQPGLGMLVVWVALLGWGLAVGLRRMSSTAPALAR